MRASCRRQKRARWGLGALAATGVLVLMPSSAQAADLAPGLPPLSVPTSAPALPGPLVTLLPPMPGLPSLPRTTSGSTSAPSPTAAPGTTSPTSLPTTTPTGGRATPQSQPQVRVGGGLAGAGYGCLSAGSANGGGLVVMDQDVLNQLAAVLPQTADFEVPCRTTSGLAADVDLVAATICLRLDPSSSAPLKATVQVAGTDVLRRLEAAGLPLDQVLAPCATTPPPVSSSDATSAPVAAPTSTSRPTQVQAAATSDTARRLPFTGAEVAPTVLFGLALVLLGAGLLRGRAPREPGC